MSSVYINMNINNNDYPIRSRISTSNPISTELSPSLQMFVHILSSQGHHMAPFVRYVFQNA